MLNFSKGRAQLNYADDEEGCRRRRHRTQRRFALQPTIATQYPVSVRSELPASPLMDDGLDGSRDLYVQVQRLRVQRRRQEFQASSGLQASCAHEFPSRPPKIVRFWTLAAWPRLCVYHCRFAAPSHHIHGGPWLRVF